MSCEAPEHLPTLEESNNDSTCTNSSKKTKNTTIEYYSMMNMIIHCECIQSEIHNVFIFKYGPDLLGDFKANMRTKSEHVLHLLGCSGDQWDV